MTEVFWYQISLHSPQEITPGETFNPFMATIKPQSNGPLYSSRVIGTLAVDEWAITFGTARRKLDRLRPRPVPSSLYQM